MHYTNRSLVLAVFACISMGLFARAPQFSGGPGWLPLAFFVTTLLLSGLGFWWGLRGARQQRTAWSWLAPFVNAFVFVMFVAFFYLLLRALHNFQ